ncbi:hypothetical protein Tco_1072520 [Tanacetum coccineum]
MNCVSQKKDVIQYPRFTKLIIADLIKKFTSIPPRFEEYYHSIMDDIPLVSVYTIGNVTIQGMMILDAFLTKEIHAIGDYKEYETVFVNVVIPMNQPQPVFSTQGKHRSTPRVHRTPTLTSAKKDVESYADKLAASMIHDDVDDSGDMIEPGSHKKHSEVVVDDDDDNNKKEKKDEKEGDEMGSLETMTEKMQTPIPTTPRSPRINLSSDKNIAKELTNIVSLSTPTTSKDSHKKRCISSKYNYLPVHGKVDQVLYEIVPQLVERATDDLIESNLKPIIVDTFIQDRDAFRSEEWDAWEEETVIDEDEVIPKDETPELITEFQNVDKRVLTLFDHARMEATLNDIEGPDIKLKGSLQPIKDDSQDV